MQLFSSNATIFSKDKLEDFQALQALKPSFPIIKDNKKKDRAGVAVVNLYVTYTGCFNSN